MSNFSTITHLVSGRARVWALLSNSLAQNFLLRWANKGAQWIHVHMSEAPPESSIRAVSHTKSTASELRNIPKTFKIIYLPFENRGCLHPVQAAVKKYHRLGVLNNRNVSLTVLDAQRPEIKVSTWSSSGGNPLPDLQTALFSLCPHMTEGEKGPTLPLFLWGH